MTAPHLTTHIDGHVNQTVAWVNMLYVVPAERGEGRGRELYEEWERSLPPEVTLIKLVAADCGDGRSNGFWEAMGFEYETDEETGDPEIDFAMRKERPRA